MRRFLLSFWLLLLVLLLGAGIVLAARLIDYESLSAETVNRVVSPLLADAHGAVVVGFTNGHSHKVYGFGSISQSKKLRPDGKTIFEIASLTKVFTCILAADLQRENKLSFDAPVKNYLPAEPIVPGLNGRQLTLLQLATHSSGMPRNADNLEQFAKYGKAQFHQFLSRCKLESMPGRKYSYSNAAYTLLGEAIENAGGKPYEELLSARILLPLQMHDTHIVLKDSEIPRLLQSFGKDGNAIASSPTSGGAAGGLKSCADDLLKLMDAAIQKSDSNLHKDIQETLKRRFRISSNESACLGWFRNDARDAYGKLGQIHGFSSAIEFSSSRRIGIVVLSSTLRVEAANVLQKCSDLIYRSRKAASLR